MALSNNGIHAYTMKCTKELLKLHFKSSKSTRGTKQQRLNIHWENLTQTMHHNQFREIERDLAAQKKEHINRYQFTPQTNKTNKLCCD